jgi:hypothetical protein
MAIHLVIGALTTYSGRGGGGEGGGSFKVGLGLDLVATKTLVGSDKGCFAASAPLFALKTFFCRDVQLLQATVFPCGIYSWSLYRLLAERSRCLPLRGFSALLALRSCFARLSGSKLFVLIHDSIIP